MKPSDPDRSPDALKRALGAIRDLRKRTEESERRTRVSAGAGRLTEPFDAIASALHFPVAIVSGTVEEWCRGLSPAEARLVQNAVEKRRRQFEAGRGAAREALSTFGSWPETIGRGARGEPLWPPGFAGSITHTDGMVAVAVARDEEVEGIGIDVEASTPLSEELIGDVLRPEEIAALGNQGGFDPGTAAKVAFSAKEAVYKCIFPVSRELFGFHDVALQIEPGGSAFRASARRDFSGAQHVSRGWGVLSVSAGFIGTAFVLPARGPDNASTPSTLDGARR